MSYNGINPDDWVLYSVSSYNGGISNVGPAGQFKGTISTRESSLFVLKNIAANAAFINSSKGVSMSVTLKRVTTTTAVSRRTGILLCPRWRGTSMGHFGQFDLRNGGIGIGVYKYESTQFYNPDRWSDVVAYDDTLVPAENQSIGLRVDVLSRKPNVQVIGYLSTSPLAVNGAGETVNWTRTVDIIHHDGASNAEILLGSTGFPAVASNSPTLNATPAFAIGSEFSEDVMEFSNLRVKQL